MPGYVYILTNQPRGTLYIGVTNNIHRRVQEHQQGPSGFAKRYKLHRLVFVEEHPTLPLAIQREKSLKRYQRQWKIELIEHHNPTWQDLSQQLICL